MDFVIGCTMQHLCAVHTMYFLLVFRRICPIGIQVKIVHVICAIVDTENYGMDVKSTLWGRKKVAYNLFMHFSR